MVRILIHFSFWVLQNLSLIGMGINPKTEKSPAQSGDLLSFFFIKYTSKARRNASSTFIVPYDSFPSLSGELFWS
jgi:hypothetical protein